MVKRTVIIIPANNLIEDVPGSTAFPNIVVRDILELVIYCQLDSMRANGIEAVYAKVPHLISPIEFIDEELRDHFSDRYANLRYEQLRKMAYRLWDMLPIESIHQVQVADVKDPHLRLKWHNEDLLIEVH